MLREAALTIALSSLCLAAPASAATVLWINSDDADWDEPVNWSGNAVPGADDDVIVDVVGASPLVTIRQSPLSGPAFTQYFAKSVTAREAIRYTGGSLNVTGDATFESGFFWSGGSINAFAVNPTGTWTFRQGIQVSGSQLLGIGAGHFVLQGTSVLASTRGILGSGSAVDIAAGATLHVDAGDLFGLGQGTLNIRGTFDRRAGDGDFLLQTSGGGNTGTVHVGAGRLRYHNLDVDHVAQVHTGTFQVDAGAVLELISSHDVQGALQGNGDVVLNNPGAASNTTPISLHLANYALGGTLRFLPGAVVRLVGDGSIAHADVGNSSILFEGTVTFSNLVSLGLLNIHGAAGNVLRFADGIATTNGIVQFGKGRMELGGTTRLAMDTQFLAPIDAESRMVVLPGARLELVGGATTPGHGVLGDGTLVNRGTMVRDGTGMARISSGFINEGELTLHSGDLQLFPSAAFENRGRVVVEGGTMIDRSHAIYRQTAGETILDGFLFADEVRIDGGVLRGNGRIGGELGAAGILGSVVNNGEIAPGHSAGTLVFDGHYVQGAAGVLTMELGDTSDRLVIGGDADLAGALAIRFVGGFVPTLGQSFELLTYRSHVGSLALVALGEAARPGYAFDLVFGDHAATLRVSALAPVPEPATLLLLAAGLGAVGLRTRRQ